MGGCGTVAMERGNPVVMGMGISLLLFNIQFIVPVWYCCRNLMVLFSSKQAETTEELNEWRSALESALAQAPSVANTVGQNPIFSTDGTEPSEAPTEQCKLC
jgi:hypothetical protein